MSRNPSKDEDRGVISDARPLALAKPRDAAAEKEFDALFRVHYESVYRLLYRIVGTREEAEDLAQETFLRLDGAIDNPRFAISRTPDQSGTGRNLRAWLYRVASNLAFNALRGEGRRQRRQETVASRTVIEGRQEEDPAEFVVRTDEIAAVRQALAALSQQQARLLLLRHAGLSYRELAEALNVAQGSIGTMLNRAETAFEKSYRRLERSSPDSGVE